MRLEKNEMFCFIHSVWPAQCQYARSNDRVMSQFLLQTILKTINKILA